MPTKGPKWEYKKPEAGLSLLDMDYERVMQIICDDSNRGITFAVEFYEAVISFKYDLGMEKQKPSGTEVRAAAKVLGKDTETLINRLENIIFSTEGYVYGVLHSKVNPDSFIQKLKKDLSLLSWALSETESDYASLHAGAGRKSARFSFAFRIAILFKDILHDTPTKYDGEMGSSTYAECLKYGLVLAEGNAAPKDIRRLTSDAIDEVRNPSAIITHKSG
mgnify:CR=1 FL=1